MQPRYLGLVYRRLLVPFLCAAMAVQTLGCASRVLVHENWLEDRDRWRAAAYSPALDESCEPIEFRQGDAMLATERPQDRNWYTLRVRNGRQFTAGMGTGLLVAGSGALAAGIYGSGNLEGSGRFVSGLGAAAGLGMLMASVGLLVRRINRGPALRTAENEEAFEFLSDVRLPRRCRENVASE
ncbi:MAG: hypothetical protein ACJA1R_000135 [Flavobacteriales bacterium]|jgi:hypothetical protein